ncbi:hypothetical protein GDO81_008962 [Engystomops pustulosus]|uniref:Olfactory receptor n=1 Tax=Engystomops pustulosus TaxID=76066 RepID=A0AAV7BN79_ENGPU|nr:hypothetical protein GDO81_008962 [Engystomops pustulosus]
MDSKNQSLFKAFIITGFSDFPDLEMPIVLFFILSYMITLLANILLICLIFLSPSLKTPMYFFLCSLSGMDILCATSVSPNLIHMFLKHNNVILLSWCTVQFLFSAGSAGSEYFVLTVMSYDRYVAVCKPLHYSQLLSKKFCMISSIGSWVTGFSATFAIAIIFPFNDFCISNVIDHFFCDLNELLELSCSNISLIWALMLVDGALLFTCFILTITSYTFIISSILKIQSVQKKNKTFSTCASHLMAVSVFYSSISILYLIPNVLRTQSQRKLITILYTNVIPMVNPFIYSLRNKDVSKSMRHLLRQAKSF